MDANTIADGIMLFFRNVAVNIFLVLVIYGIGKALMNATRHWNLTRQASREAEQRRQSDPAYVARKDAAFRSFMGMS